MGGKKRQAQRTKNNAMPSNSGRSAEYLSSNIPHFSGFSGMKETGLIFPLMATEDIESCIDANYQSVFKKMNKKDSTTKIKALQEFADSVKNSDAEEVKAVLPCWPRLYNTLATDSEHKVREATHVAHNEVVQKVKRNLAPHLKSLIAAWFTSQYDTYPPAATAAAMSFKNAFPEKKVEEVIVFCNKEILDYIYDNSFVQTPQTVGNPKQSTPEESIAKHERVVISSLNGYSSYLKKIPKEKIVESSESNRKIINNNKFWKYSRHNSMIVRAAWFEVLTALFEKAPFLLEQEEGHVVSYTLGSIDEADPILLPLVWQNVLLVTSMKDWHTKVNIDKLMLPKLWKILKDGGNGNASTIFPNLLPSLSNMMEIVDVNTFYYNFFRNLCASLKAKSVVASRSESTAISTSFIECIRYVIMKHESNVELCEKIIKYYSISSIHWCVTETQSCYKTIFNQTASSVQYWSRNNVKEESNYFRYLTYFWNNINSLFEGVLMDSEISNSEKMSQLAETQVEFLKTMKHMAKVKKCLKVKFNVSNETIPTIHETSPSNQLNEFYLNGLQDTVLRLCEIYVKLISGKNSKELMDHLAALIDEFDSTNFFNLLSKKMTGDQHSDVIILFEKLSKNWLDCENLLCKSLIHIVFSTFKHLGDEGKQIVSDNSNKISNAECVGWCLEEALSHQYNKDILIRKWSMNDKVTNFLVDIVEKKVSACCPANFCVLLKIAITENAEEELYVSQEAISKILEKLKEPSSNPNDHSQSIDACLSLAANLSAVIYTKNYSLTFTDDSLLSLLRSSCDTSINKDYSSSDTTWEVQTAWQDALTLLSSSLSKNELEPTMGKVVSFFHKSLETENLGEDKLQRLITALINVSRAIYKSTPFQINDILNDIFNHTIILNQRKFITDICKWAEYSNGNLASCYEEFEVISDVKVDCKESLQFFTWLYVRVKVLTAKVCDTVDDDEEDDDEEIGDIWSFLDVKMNWIIQISYDLELGKCFLLNFETVKSSIEIEKFVKKAVSIYISSMKRFSKDDVNSLWLTLRAQARSSCWIWIRAIYTSQICLSSEDPIKIYEDLSKDVTTDDKLAVVQSTQVFSKHLNYDYVACSFDSVSRIVISRCLSRNKEIDVQIAEVMSTLESLRNDTEKFSWENFKLDWQPYQIILETCRLFNELIKYQFDSLSSKQIDLIVISLTEWLQRVVQLNKIEKVKPMLIAITNLYQIINYKINESREPEKIIPLVKEWDDLFAEGAQTDLVNSWLGYAGHFKGIQNALPIRELPVMYSFTSMTNCFNHKSIFRQSEDMPSRRSRLLKESCELLTSNLSTLQLAGYKTLLSLIPGLVDIDTEAVDTNTPNKDGLIFEMFKGICLSTQEIVSTMLLDFKLGEDSCRVEPFTDSYNYTLAYLSIWDVMLCLCEKASMELKFQYADWLRQEDILKNLLDNLFRLMPIEIFQHADSKNLYHAEWFSSRVEFQEKICTSADLEHMVCWIYYSASSQLPALVRLWWTGVETRIAQIVEKITSVYVSPLLCSRESKVISQHEKKFKNMTVKVSPTVREVVAVYTVDESQMELIITLPTNYPLGGPEVQCNRQIGGSTKQWLMQFKKCVSHQNGRIWDGLSLWNNSLDKKFDGVEECYICFAVSHPGTYQSPKLSCQTCRKKFHAPCLYKWFSTSNKSSCPICRNLF